MVKKWFAGLALVALLPLAAHAGGLAKPTAVVRVRSLDTLVDNAKLLITLAGREEIAKQVEGLIKAKIGVQGLEGIDPGRPLGAYATFGAEITDVSGVVLVPIADEKAFLALLENLNYKATKGKNDIYTVPTGTQIDAYLRFANRYAYVTALKSSTLEGKLPDPVQILGKDGPTFAAKVFLDQLPEVARQIAIDQIEQNLQAESTKKVPGETPAQKAFRAAAVKEITKLLVGVLKEGGELSLALDLDSKSKELSANLSLAGKAGSELAQTIQNLGQGKSQFGGWRGADVAFRGLTHVILPAEIRQRLDKVLDEGVAESLGKLQDPAQRRQAQQLIDAILPTLKAGELDSCVQLLGPGADQKYAIVAGVKVKDGVKLGNTLRDLTTDLLKQIPEAQRDLIKLDFASVGAVKIHRLDLPAEAPEVQKLQAVLGETQLHIAFRDDAVLVAVGKDSLTALKEIVGKQAVGPSPILSYEVDVARLAPILAPNEELRASAKKIFANAQDGRVRLTLEGGKAFQLSLTTRLAVVQFFSQAHEFKAGN